MDLLLKELLDDPDIRRAVVSSIETYGHLERIRIIKMCRLEGEVDSLQSELGDLRRLYEELKDEVEREARPGKAAENPAEKSERKKAEGSRERATGSEGESQGREEERSRRGREVVDEIVEDFERFISDLSYTDRSMYRPYVAWCLALKGSGETEKLQDGLLELRSMIRKRPGKLGFLNEITEEALKKLVEIGE